MFCEFLLQFDVCDKGEKGDYGGPIRSCRLSDSSEVRRSFFIRPADILVDDG